MTYKEQLQKDYGVTYESFRSWLLRDKGIKLSDLEDADRIDYIYEYQEKRRMSNFEEKYGFSRKSFIGWVKKNHGLNYATLDYDDFMAYIALYREYRLYKTYSREELIYILKKYIVGASDGSEIELDEHENELVEYLEGDV